MRFSQCHCLEDEKLPRSVILFVAPSEIQIQKKHHYQTDAGGQVNQVCQANWRGYVGDFDLWWTSAQHDDAKRSAILETIQMVGATFACTIGRSRMTPGPSATAAFSTCPPGGKGAHAPAFGDRLVNRHLLEARHGAANLEPVFELGLAVITFYWVSKVLGR
jgi:hypothetical protein